MTCDEMFIDINKISRMCIVLKASHKINACFSCKHASRTYRFNLSSCSSKNKPFRKQNILSVFNFASHSFVTT